MDTIWHFISSLKAADGTPMFPRLSKVGKLILTIPHSNAQEERVFSMIRKNKTAFRPSLDPKGTLSSILTIKLAGSSQLQSFEPTQEVLKEAKSATWKYNKQHRSKIILKCVLVFYALLRISLIALPFSLIITDHLTHFRM